MHYVVLATHGPEICPMGNAKVRDLLLQTAPQMTQIADKAGVKVVAGPYVNREHTTVVVLEASSGEDLDRFIVDSRLAQWNAIHILPSLPMIEGLEELQAQDTIF
jgi:hypothetical protein